MGSTNSDSAGGDHKSKPPPLSTNPEVIAEKLTSPSNMETSSRDDRAQSPPTSSATSAHFNLPKSEASTPGVEKPSYDLPLLTKQSLKVGLVGAGIGGLTAAIAIARAGCDVTVLEAAAELGEIGAGIQITPYRAVLPYEEVYRNVPESRDFGNDIDVFTMEKGYVIMYPIAAGREWNAVMAHVTDKPVTDVEEDCSMEEMREYYKDMDERVTKILELVPSTKRWPLMTVGPLKSWSSPQKNVAIMGDAAHAMVNHLDQGAATSMEDGAFLGRVLREVITGVLTLPEAVKIYEDTRMPRAWAKQQESFINGSIFMADEPRGRLRDEAAADSVAETKAMSEVWNLDSKAAVTGPDENALCPNLWGAPETLQSVFSYDPEGDADFAVIKHIQDTTPWDKVTGVSEGLEEKLTGWFWPKDQVGRVAKARGTDL
ncbi:uncharacterized protein MYCGRDRAFT_111077 [Zymoseptoria tritici IPO323]|uniref:FAD-binding domain-containing protein n=1 Tax=Zymoseptoria tritici (strain CBS 115943 / IPO323) TaxID=336722 RepID=F9XLF3_ZYMTI|nr:uncharacterized protein MYCGRDRAFT_111077 [Zymoseptoria tritici IPO323]EGP83881.1 hypothetical protein MYCGRDRAFT_111077 [Zymoseptoria tritici IPO323]